MKHLPNSPPYVEVQVIILEVLALNAAAGRSNRNTMREEVWVTVSDLSRDSSTAGTDSFYVRGQRR